MKFILISFLFIINFCHGQEWQAEVMGGASGYNGDLTQNLASLKKLKPTAGVYVKYDINNILILRVGIAWGMVAADDKNNKNINLQRRNLNFTRNIIEGSLCAEINLFEPGVYYSYPYIFGGVGIFHFDPYTYDKDNKKTYLPPLSTEGEGLPEYPNRKPYKLIQLCLPVGAGWKLNLNKRWDVIYEIGYRILFTDYLDDVSTTYVNSQTLQMYKGEKAVELAVRQKPATGVGLPHDGTKRGSPDIKDSYFFSGLKLLIHVGKK
jgi:hypothetical protein